MTFLRIDKVWRILDITIWIDTFFSMLRLKNAKI